MVHVFTNGLAGGEPGSESEGQLWPEYHAGMAIADFSHLLAAGMLVAYLLRGG